MVLKLGSVGMYLSTEIMSVSGFPYTCDVPIPSWTPSSDLSGIDKATVDRAA